METDRKPVLTISTEIVRPTVLIDGKSYGMLSPLELGIVEQARFRAIGRELEELGRKPDLGDEETARLAGLVKGLVQQLLPDLPDEIRAALTDGLRLEIIAAFIHQMEQRTRERQGASDG